MKRSRILSIGVILLPMTLGAQQPSPADAGTADGWAHRAASREGELSVVARFSGRVREVTSKDSLPEAVKAAWPKDTLVVRLRASLVFCRDAMETLTDANLGDELPAASEMRQAPRARFVLLFLTDLADHYSQIANYMRLLRLVPPSALPAPTR